MADRQASKQGLSGMSHNMDHGSKSARRTTAETAGKAWCATVVYPLETASGYKYPEQQELGKAGMWTSGVM